MNIPVRTRWLLGILACSGVIAVVSGAVPPGFFTADPNDPLYPRTANSQGCTVAGSPTCIDPPGQWDLYSFSPTVPATAHPSGISADQAWRVTAGRPDVVAVVFDSGVNYDHEDLRNKIWLNCGELPAPQNAQGAITPGSSPGCREPNAKYDLNDDGAYSIQDYANDPRVTTRVKPLGAGKISVGDIHKAFADGVDQDNNGYPDDLSGYDFDDNDSDEYDQRDFGHGTGRNGIIGAEANNSVGIAGVCPYCRIANARIEDTYVVIRSDTTANAAVWAGDHRFSVINMALGHVGSSPMSRKAFEYAYSRNVLPMSAIANEFHFHHGYVGLYDEVMAIGALSYAGPTTAGIAPSNGQPTQAPTTYLRKANYSNYGAHLDVVAPSDTLTTSQGNPEGSTQPGYGDSSGTSSATPHAVGTAGLIISEARNLIDAGMLNTTGLALKEISNQEVRQIINQTADDIKPGDDPAQGTYPVKVGWDKYTGYGRINANAAVHLLADNTGTGNRIPPEADINAPDWYSYVDGVVTVRSYANNRWRGNYNWVLEYGPGVEPAAFTQIAAGSAAADKAIASTSLVNNLSSSWDTTGLTPGGYTLRLRVSDAGDATIKGEDRMFVWVRKGLVDPDNHRGWPQRITTKFNGEDIPASAESMSNALVDLDGDNKLEVIVTTAEGEVRAYHEDGTLMTGFPVRTEPLPGLPIGKSPAFDGNPSNGEVPISGASIIGGVAVGDIDGDGVQDICAGAVNGKVYCWNADGSLKKNFPVSTDLPKQYDQYTRALTARSLQQGEALVSPPTFSNVDGDAAGTLEIAAVSRDQKLYVWKADGSRLTGFPVTLGKPGDKAPPGSISGVLAADIDKDGKMDLVVGTNEVEGQTGNTNGIVYAFNRDGTPKTGWPVKPASAAANGVPIVAQGVVNGPLAANLDARDASLEVVTAAFLGDVSVYKANGSAFNTLSGTLASSGGSSYSQPNEETPAGGPARADDAPVHSYVGLGAIADFSSSAPGLEYLAGTIGNNLVVNVAAGSGAVTSFDHYFSAWNVSAGTHLPNFPRVVEGWQFIAGPAVADLDGKGPDAIVTSSGLFVHAFNNSSGTDIAGWPKFVGNWIVATPSVGDIDGDGNLEVVTTSRLGEIHIWNTRGKACNGAAANAQWRKYRHDEWNTGSFDTDTLRPNRINSISSAQQQQSVSLTFIAPGDDGACGKADHYEVRRVAGSVSNPDWASATFVKVQPAGSNAGAQDTVGLGQQQPGAYTFLIRAYDEAGNGSPLTSIPVTVAAAATGSNTGTAAVVAVTVSADGPGTTVSAGGFRLTNPGSGEQSISAVTIALSEPGIFSSLRLQGGGVDMTISTLSSSTAFNFPQPLILAANQGVDFTLTATLSSSQTAKTDGAQFIKVAAVSGGMAAWINSAEASDRSPAQSLGPATAVLILLLLISFMLRRYRLLALALLSAGLMLAGCNNGGGETATAVDNSPAPVQPVPQPKSSTVDLTTVAATSGGQTVTYYGLPTRLATVTRNP